MKKTLLYKFILGYLLSALLSVLFLQLCAPEMVSSQIYDYQAASMYNACYMLTSSPDTLTEERMEIVSDTLDADVWEIDARNNILYSTRLPKEMKRAERFDISDIGNKTYIVGTFHNAYDEKVITVAQPIIQNYTTNGYILIHYPVAKVEDIYNSIMGRVYLIAFVIYGLSLIMLIMFLFLVYRPVIQLSEAAREFAKGNLTYSGLKKFRGDDEIGRLGVSLNFMASELNTLEEDQKKFIANISHDFRSPLTSIKGYVEAMADGTIPPEMQEKYLNIVLFETDRLTKLTSNLLNLNAWENGNNRLDLTNVKIYDMIKPILMSFEGKCKKKRIHFEFNMESKDFVVSIDKDKIQQVIYNLIDNAIKFSNTDSAICINVVQKNDKIFLSIKDSGIGIPKDSLSKIWDRFYKTDLSRGKDKTGSGLGLSIAREIIQTHGENINVVSTEGVGTEFTFTMKKVN